jgi:hypothetical protein
MFIAPLVIGFSAILISAEIWLFEASCEIGDSSYTRSGQLYQLFTLLIWDRLLVTQQPYQLLHLASRVFLKHRAQPFQQSSQVDIAAALHPKLPSCLSRSLARIIGSRDRDLLNLWESQQCRCGRTRDQTSFHGSYQFGAAFLSSLAARWTEERLTFSRLAASDWEIGASIEAS